MPELIAAADLVDTSKGDRSETRIQVYKPVKLSTYEYRCTATIDREGGIIEVPVIGETSLSSLTLAISGIMTILEKPCREGSLYLPSDCETPIDSLSSIFGICPT